MKPAHSRAICKARTRSSCLLSLKILSHRQKSGVSKGIRIQKHRDTTYRERATPRIEGERNTSKMTTTQKEVWRSKLGTNYPKDFMQKNEARLFNELQAIRDLPENRMCADCGVRGTVWASVNLGVFLCMTCGAHHRSLGTHISLPKGCTGTYWWGPDEIEKMRSIGNARARELYGDHKPNNISKDDGTQWKQYLTEKYVEKKFTAHQTPTFLDIGHQHASMPSASPKLSSMRRSSKFTKQPMPDIDLIHFESVHHSPTGVASSPQQARKVAAPEPPAVGDDFFASFGV